jgi:hypothetical protein
MRIVEIQKTGKISAPPQISSFIFSEIVLYSAHPAPSRRGVARDRHDTRGGDAMAAFVLQRSLLRRRTAWRGREGVWSWRPDAGAKSAGDDPADDGG